MNDKTFYLKLDKKRPHNKQILIQITLCPFMNSVHFPVFHFLMMCKYKWLFDIIAFLTVNWIDRMEWRGVGWGQSLGGGGRGMRFSPGELSQIYVIY